MMKLPSLPRFFLFILLMPLLNPVFADDVVILGCRSQYVDLDRGRTRLAVCYTAEAPEDRIDYAVSISGDALPLIEHHYGSPYQFDFMRIELGHNHSGGVAGYVETGFGGSLTTIDWLMVHEMIHSFWHSATCPRWLAEGTANHGAMRIRAEILELDVEDELRGRRDYVWSECETEGYDEILLRDSDDNYAAAARLGDVFLIDIFFMLGPDRFDAAYQELYTEMLASGSVDETDFARAFINHCPTELKCDMWNLFVERMDNTFYCMFNKLLCDFAGLGIFGVLLALLIASIITIAIIMVRFGGADERRESRSPFNRG